MGRRLLLINVVMLVGIYLLARHVTASWHDYQAANSVSKVAKEVKPPGAKETEVTAPAPPEAPLPEAIFAVIPDKDLFSPERRPPPPPEPQKEEVAPKLARNPSLNGILNNQGKKQALITIYESANAQKGQPRTVGLGDNIQGYTVSDIADTALTMKWKDAEIVIDMFGDTPEQPKAVQHKAAPPQIVTIGSSGPAVDAGSDSEAPAGAEAATVQPGGIQPGGMRPGAGGARMQPGNAPQRGEGAVAPANRPGTVGMPGAVPFTSRTRRENP